ncbi:hypothetical protein TNCV_2310371 [Trichonephila clavipes]|nr:hypothetical protein TNCV_2310371 [Trichonephila clavipes]
MVWATTKYTTRTSLVLVDGNLNAVGTFLTFTSICCAVSLRPAKQGNTRPHVARCVLIFLDTQSIRLFSWPARPPDDTHIHSKHQDMGC